MTFSDMFSMGTLCRIRLYWKMGLYWGSLQNFVSCWLGPAGCVLQGRPTLS